MSQCQIILDELKAGPITAADAMEKHGIYRLAARINDLRKRGHNIVTELHKVSNANNGFSVYAKYHYYS